MKLCCSPETLIIYYKIKLNDLFKMYIIIHYITCGFLNIYRNVSLVKNNNQQWSMI